MAVADDDVEGTEKSTFGCLDAARYVVAAAVTLLIGAVIVYAVTVVLRPAELGLWVVGGSVSAKRSGNRNLTKPYDFHVGGDNLIFGFALRAVNPSGRVRIYYTGITAKLRARNSTGAANTVAYIYLEDVDVGPQSTVDSDVLSEDVPLEKPSQVEYFKTLGNGRSIDEAWLMLNGTRTVENYSGHNMTGVPAIYYCSPLSVGGDHDHDGGETAALDSLCTENPPTEGP